MLNLLVDVYIHAMMVPANCTYRLQPMDISVNKAVKHLSILHKHFQAWYANKVLKQLNSITERT